MGALPGAVSSAPTIYSQPAKGLTQPVATPMLVRVASPQQLVGISPALSDFIDFQGMLSASKNMRLKHQGKVSVLKTSLVSGAVAAGLIALGGWFKFEKIQLLFGSFMIGLLGAFQGALVGLIMNHGRD